MKKLIILILMIGCLLCCQKPVDMYTGILNNVEYSPKSSWGGMDSWTLTFEDGQVYTIHSQLLAGFKIGNTYTIYTCSQGYLRVRQGR